MATQLRLLCVYPSADGSIGKWAIAAMVCFPVWAGHCTYTVKDTKRKICFSNVLIHINLSSAVKSFSAKCWTEGFSGWRIVVQFV